MQYVRARENICVGSIPRNNFCGHWCNEFRLYFRTSKSNRCDSLPFPLHHVIIYANARKRCPRQVETKGRRVNSEHSHGKSPLWRCISSDRYELLCKHLTTSTTQRVIELFYCLWIWLITTASIIDENWTFQHLWNFNNNTENDNVNWKIEHTFYITFDYNYYLMKKNFEMRFTIFTLFFSRCSLFRIICSKEMIIQNELHSNTHCYRWKL